MAIDTDKNYKLHELTDPDSFLFPGHGYDEMETGFTDEESLEDIKGIFLSLKEDEYITPDEFEDILNQWYVPDKYQNYLAEFVAGLNQDHADNLKIEKQELERRHESKYDPRIYEENIRFSYQPTHAEQIILRKREAYLDSHGRAPTPEEITSEDRFYTIIEKQFQSKAARREIITDDDIVYTSTCWTLSPAQLI